METAMQSLEKLGNGKEVLGYEMFCDGCAVCAMYGKGLDKRRGARARRCSETTCEGMDKPG